MEARGAGGVGIVACGQCPVKPRQGAGGERKAPKQSQIARALVIGRLQLRTNQGGIGQANKPIFGGRQRVVVASGGRTVDRDSKEANHVSRAPESGWPPPLLW